MALLVKLFERKFKLIQKLREINDLFESGLVLTDERQKEHI